MGSELGLGGFASGFDELSSMVCALDLLGSRQGNTFEGAVMSDTAHAKKIIHFLIERGELASEGCLQFSEAVVQDRLVVGNAI